MMREDFYDRRDVKGVAEPFWTVEGSIAVEGTSLPAPFVAFTWSARGYPKVINTQPYYSDTMQYDPFGRRTQSKTFLASGTTTTNYLFEQSNVVQSKSLAAGPLVCCTVSRWTNAMRAPARPARYRIF